jgi:hypothetical protein
LWIFKRYCGLRTRKFCQECLVVTSSQLMKVCFLTPLALRSIGSLVVSPTMLSTFCMDHKYLEGWILASFPWTPKIMS